MDDIESRLVAAVERRLTGGEQDRRRGVTVCCTIIVLVSLALHGVTLLACFHYARQARLHQDATAQLYQQIKALTDP